MNMAVKPARRIALSLSHDHSHGPLGYLEMGRPAGPPVVFLHGFGADLLTWSLCLGPLARDYRLIALDLPGHGRTHPDVGDGTLAFMTGWLDEALDGLGLASAHLVGHSMGARIALGFVLSHPARVRSLSLIAPALQVSLGFTDFQLGMLQGLGMAVFASVASYPMGWLADRYGRRLVLAAGVAIWSLATGFSAFQDSFGGLFAVYAYLASTLMAVTGVKPVLIPLVFCVFGAGLTAGNLFAPHFADRALMPTAGALLAWSIVALLLYPLAAHNVWTISLDVFLVGCGAALGTVLQARLMDVAGEAQLGVGGR